MKNYKTLDLWTEQHRNQFELFNGCFLDGFANGEIPFDKYKVIKNCNCVITSNSDNLPIGNKHNAVVFYKNGNAVRLLVAFKDTNIDFCLENALNQKIGGVILGDLYKTHNIEAKFVDLKQEPNFNNYNLSAGIEIDVAHVIEMYYWNKCLKEVIQKMKVNLVITIILNILTTQTLKLSIY